MKRVGFWMRAVAVLIDAVAILLAVCVLSVVWSSASKEAMGLLFNGVVVAYSTTASWAISASSRWMLLGWAT